MNPATSVETLFSGLSADEQAILDQADRFAREQLYPLSERMDREEWWPSEVFARIGETGYFGIPVPESLGGAGMDLFTSGSIQPGTRLPPERHLATVLGVGRSAVREALAALEILGIVDVRPGSGTYLRGTASELLPQTQAQAQAVVPQAVEPMADASRPSSTRKASGRTPSTAASAKSSAKPD